jgi:hypothetical protein
MARISTYKYENEAIQELIDKAGSPELVAHALGVSRMCLYNWQRKGEFNPFEALLAESKFGISKEKLAPQVIDWPAQCNTVGDHLEDI